MHMSYHHAASPTRHQKSSTHVVSPRLTPASFSVSAAAQTHLIPSPTYTDYSEMDTPKARETTSPGSLLSMHQTDSGSIGPRESSGSGQQGSPAGTGPASGWWWSLPPVPADPNNQPNNPFRYSYHPFSMDADTALGANHASEMPSPNTPSSENQWDAPRRDSLRSNRRCHSTPNFANMDLDFLSPTHQPDPAETPPNPFHPAGYDVASRDPMSSHRDLDLDGDLDGDLDLATRRAVSFNIPEDSEGDTDTDRMHMTEPEDSLESGEKKRTRERDRTEGTQLRLYRERSGSTAGGSQGRKSESDTREMSEEEKKINRRLRNSVASLKLREKRKKEYEMLERMARDKTKLAKELGNQVMLLETEARYLKQLVMFHSFSNPTAMAAMQFHMATNQMISDKSDQGQSDRNRTSERDLTNQSNQAVTDQNRSGGSFSAPPTMSATPSGTPSFQSNAPNPPTGFPFIQPQQRTTTTTTPSNPPFNQHPPPPPSSLQTPSSYPFVPLPGQNQSTYPPHSSPGFNSSPPAPRPQHTSPLSYAPVPFRRHASYGSGQQNPTHPPSTPFTNTSPPAPIPTSQPHPTPVPQHTTTGSSPPASQLTTQPTNQPFPLNLNMNDPAAAAAAMAFAAYYGGLPTHIPPPPISGNSSYGPPHAQPDGSMDSGPNPARPDSAGTSQSLPVPRLQETESGSLTGSTGLPLPPFFSSFYPPPDPFAPNLPNMATDGQHGSTVAGNPSGRAATSPPSQAGAGRKGAGAKQKGARKRR